MAAEFRPVAPVDPTNLRPMLFLDAARQIVPLHPRAEQVWREHGYLA